MSQLPRMTTIRKMNAEEMAKYPTYLGAADNNLKDKNGGLILLHMDNLNATSTVPTERAVRARGTLKHEPKHVVDMAVENQRGYRGLREATAVLEDGRTLISLKEAGRYINAHNTTVYDSFLIPEEGPKSLLYRANPSALLFIKQAMSKRGFNELLKDLNGRPPMTRQSFGALLETLPYLEDAKSFIKWFNKGGFIRQYNQGGQVPGFGHKDTIPAMLTPGEFVVRAPVAKKYSNELTAINNGVGLERSDDGMNYAAGGWYTLGIGSEKATGRGAFTSKAYADVWDRTRTVAHSPNGISDFTDSKWLANTEIGQRYAELSKLEQKRIQNYYQQERQRFLEGKGKKSTAGEVAWTGTQYAGDYTVGAARDAAAVLIRGAGVAIQTF